MLDSIKISHYILLSLSLLLGCSGLEESERERIRKMNATGEYIYRNNDEISFGIELPKHQPRARYPWEDTYIGNHIKITKEFFRCRGNPQNPAQTKQGNGQSLYTFDCGGMQQHSLPLHEGKEYIYPALMEILNYIQEKTQKKVIITCGHRCPTHNTYADSSSPNRTSKHMIGAEVDFYVKGLEWNPDKILDIIRGYYQEHPQLKKDSKLTQFHRFEHPTDTATSPWYNKEIFLKIFNKDEGRDLDNDHHFPYISIQLKWDREKNEPISYSWSNAFNGYLRY